MRAYVFVVKQTRCGIIRFVGSDVEKLKGNPANQSAARLFSQKRIVVVCGAVGRSSRNFS
jgi:hypothetical protein